MNKKRKFVLPVAVILLGLFWLLNIVRFLGKDCWLYVGLLIIISVSFFIYDRTITRGRFVGGGAFLVCAIATLLWQFGVYPAAWIVPVLVIGCGVFMLFAQFIKEPIEKNETNNVADK